MISTFDLETQAHIYSLSFIKILKKNLYLIKNYFCGFGAGLQWSTVITTLKKRLYIRYIICEINF